MRWTGGGAGRTELNDSSRVVRPRLPSNPISAPMAPPSALEAAVPPTRADARSGCAAAGTRPAEAGPLTTGSAPGSARASSCAGVPAGESPLAAVASSSGSVAIAAAKLLSGASAIGAAAVRTVSRWTDGEAGVGSAGSSRTGSSDAGGCRRAEVAVGPATVRATISGASTGPAEPGSSATTGSSDLTAGPVVAPGAASRPSLGSGPAAGVETVIGADPIGADDASRWIAGAAASPLEEPAGAGRSPTVRSVTATVSGASGAPVPVRVGVSDACAAGALGCSQRTVGTGSSVDSGSPSPDPVQATVPGPARCTVGSRRDAAGAVRTDSSAVPRTGCG